jgi:hypothetical protein
MDNYETVRIRALALDRQVPVEPAATGMPPARLLPRSPFRGSQSRMFSSSQKWSLWVLQNTGIVTAKRRDCKHLRFAPTS